MLVFQQTNDHDAFIDQQAEDDAFYAATLREMVALGLDIGRIIHQQVVAHAIDSPHSPIPQSASHDYDRVFRSVRRGIMLAKRLNQPLPERPDTEARRQTLREPGETIASQATTPERSERLDADVRDRLDDREREEDLGNRPTQEIFDQIRQDLGLPPTAPPRSDTGMNTPVTSIQRSETHNSADPPRTMNPHPPNDPAKGPPYPPMS